MVIACIKLRGLTMIGINEIWWGMIIGLTMIAIDAWFIPGGIY